MLETFKYKPRFRIASLGYGVLAPIFLIIFPIAVPFSIGIGGITLVPYPWTIALFWLAAVGFLWPFISKTRQAMALRNEDCTITIGDGMFNYRDVVKGKIEDIRFPLESVDSVKYDEEEGELEIAVDEGDKLRWYTLDMRYFETQEDWDRFYDIMTNL